MIIDTWGANLSAAFSDLWIGIVSFVPNLVIALVVITVGWVIGSIFARAVAQVFRSVNIDRYLKTTGIDEALQRGGMHLNSGAFVGGLVKWFVIAVFLMAAFEILGLTDVNNFLEVVVVAYLPNVIVAVLVLLVAGVLGDVMDKTVVASARAAHFRSARLLGTITRWAIWIFAFLVALSHLGIATEFVQTLFTGVVIALALGFGLAFGLGGQEAAARFIEKVRHDISDHR